MAASEPPSRPTDTFVSAPARFAANTRLLVMAGVASACVLGAAAGAWVRPEADDLKPREVARAPQPRVPPTEPVPQMQIVVDTSLPSAQAPLEVLPGFATPPPVEPEPTLEPFAAPPMRDAPSLRQAKAEAPPPEIEAPRPKRVLKVEVAQPKPKPEKPKLAKRDKPKSTELAKVEKAKRAEKPKAKPDKIVVAKAEPRKPQKPPAKEKPKPVLLAKAEPKPAKPKVSPKPKIAEPPPVKLAEATPAAKVETPIKLAKVTDKASTPRAAASPRRAENPWADQDIRLARAYRRAAEAGVPEWRLERQQARWREARDAAAREAPWAVPRVYAARIAELDDLAGEAAMEWN